MSSFEDDRRRYDVDAPSRGRYPAGMWRWAVLWCLGSILSTGPSAAVPEAGTTDDVVGEIEREAERLVAAGRPGLASTLLVQSGEQLTDAGRLSEAERLLVMATEIEPRHRDAWLELGRARMMDERFLPARAALERAHELGATDARSLLYLGSARWETGDVAGAEAAFREAAAVSGGAFVATHQLGRLLLWSGRSAEAADVLDRIARADGPVDVWLDLAQAQLDAGRYEPALVGFDRVIDAVPDLTRAHYGRGRALAGLGRRGEAATALDRYRQLYEADQRRTRESGLLEADLERARSLIERGSYDEAETLLASLGESTDILLTRAEGWFARGDVPRAVELLQRAAVLAPDRGDVRQRLAELRLTQEEMR